MWSKNGILHLEDLRAAIGTEIDNKACDRGGIPCSMCGRPVAVGSETPHLHWQDDFHAVTEVVVAERIDQGFWPVGPDCYKRLNKLLGEELQKFISYPGRV